MSDRRESAESAASAAYGAHSSNSRADASRISESIGGLACCILNTAVCMSCDASAWLPCERRREAMPWMGSCESVLLCFIASSSASWHARSASSSKQRSVR
eukprot:CAMPEP_0182599138 /NCGR_PEP_ID=MMETSP1324-20130603/89736_1 /TAXON_ID=236786 /ORGANISM="Florenciella sp., Strain RCC1587" /LENGTH=100 /DNA_ID=CAMNT_0024817015 /DNA_START=66 /DNA_END=368 /DNA_ORIENTATION=-